MGQKNELNNKIECNFGWLPQNIIEGEFNLSAKAIGILLYLNNRPDNWKFYKSEIAERFSDGKSSIESGLKELENNGFLEFKRKRNDEGKFSGLKWILRIPGNKGKSAETGKSGAGKSGAGKPATNKKYSSKTNSNNKTYTVPRHTDSEAVALYLKLFEEYTDVEHQGVEASVYSEVKAKLDEYYHEWSNEEFIRRLREYFEDFNGDGLPKLQHFNTVSDRFFL